MISLLLKENGYITKNNNILEDDPDILEFLQFPIKLEEGYTLRNFFEMIEKYTYLQYLNPYFNDYIEEYNFSPQSNCIHDNIHELALMLYITTIDDKDDYEYYYNFCGIDKNGDGYVLDCIPLNKLLDIPMVIGKTILNKSIINDDDVLLWDLITEVIWELSFYGTTEERNEWSTL